MGKKITSTRRMGSAFFLNLAFAIIEIIGAFLTNSMAILSDAIHDLGDTLSLGISWYFEKKSKKKPDPKYTYGYQRFSLLGALISSFILFGAAIYVFTEAVPRLFDPQPVHVPGMIAFALLGILFNGLAVLRLSGGDSHHETIVTWHLLEDLIGWTAILLTSILLLFVEWYFLDTLLGILITIYILVHVGRNLHKVIQVLLQKSPEHVDVGQIETDIENFPGVYKAFHIHAWSLEGKKTMLTMHIVVETTLSPQEINDLKDRIKKNLRDKDIEHCTIEIHFKDQDKIHKND